MVHSLTCLAITLTCFCADAPRTEPALLEQKLYGEWVGGPCMGTIDFRADGTFERRNYSPGGHTLQGTWALKWNAVPPTLVMTCKTSSSQDFVGWKLTADLVRLNDAEFAYQEPGDEQTVDFERKKVRDK
jgi:hypothetical protein